MTVISLPRPAASTATPAAPPCVAAPDAFGVLRAWRAWAARSRDEATTGFALVRGDEGTLVLAGEGLPATTLSALSLHAHRRPNAVPAPAGVAAALTAARYETPVLSCGLRSLDDWAIEVLLRTGAAIADGLVVGLRHHGGRFELLAWARREAAATGADTRRLFGAMVPWIER